MALGGLGGPGWGGCAPLFSCCTHHQQIGANGSADLRYYTIKHCTCDTPTVGVLETLCTGIMGAPQRKTRTRDATDERPQKTTGPETTAAPQQAPSVDSAVVVPQLLLRPSYLLRSTVRLPYRRMCGYGLVGWIRGIKGYRLYCISYCCTVCTVCTYVLYCRALV